MVEVNNYELFHIRGGYRKRCTLFMDLVSKRDYPIYYTMIKNPIAMKMIKKRIYSPYYKTVGQFRDDFHLMFDNARTFNEEGSVVYQDADEMQVCVQRSSVVQQDVHVRIPCRKYSMRSSMSCVLAACFHQCR